MLSRLLPHPLLTLTLTLVWILLVNELSLGHLLLGLFLGLAIPIVTRGFWPDRPLLRNPLRMAEYMAVVLWDIVVANVVVAWTVVFKPNRQLRTTFIAVPLDLRRPEAITALAGTVTITPGTVSTDLSADGRSLLVHCLDTPDPDATRKTIKRRYERRLKEIFE